MPAAAHRPNAAKRLLDFHSGDEVIAEIERLRTGGYAKLKQWNLTQICEHLSATMEAEMTGLGFRLPWVLRATAGKLLTHRILRTRRMPSSPTLPRLQPQATADAEDEAVIAQCLETIRRTECYQGSLADYPFVDNLTHEQWRQLMWIHAAHHLGFLIPNSTAN